MLKGLNPTRKKKKKTFIKPSVPPIFCTDEEHEKEKDKNISKVYVRKRC